MKRVLNSGTIKLPYVKGSEADVLRYQNDLSTKEYLDIIFNGCETRLELVSFRFEIKAPLLTFLAFQDSNLGTLNRLHELDHPIAYLPPQFYTSNLESLDSKTCNAYNTKLYNFYSAAINFYNKLVTDGMCKEQAKLVLPQGMLVNFAWTADAGEVITFIEKFYNVSPELYGYCTTLAVYLEEHMPEAVKWLKQNRWQNISL